MVEVFASMAYAAVTDTFIAQVNDPYGLSQTSDDYFANATVYNSTWLDFDGVDDYVVIADSDYLDLSDGMAINFWYKSNDIGKNTYIMKKENTAYVDIFQSSNSQYIKLRFGSPYTETCEYNDQLLENNTWYMFTFSINSSGVCRAYRNSVPDGADWPGYTGTISGTGVLNIGKRASGDNINGSIQNIRIYNKTLSTVESQILYNESMYGRNTRILALMIHSVGVSSQGDSNIDYDLFDSILDFYNSSGYHSITVDNYIDWRYNNNYTIPSKPIMFIFDDGRYDTYTNASVLMDKYGYVGNVPIVSTLITEGCNQGSFFMCWTQVNELKDKGWSLISHTYNDTSESMLTYDIDYRDFQYTESQQDILSETGVNVSSFVFYGNHQNSTLIEECLKHYTLCFGDSYSSHQWNNGTYNYIYKDSKQTEGTMFRVGMNNNSKLENVKRNSLFEYLAIELNLNENSGTTAYDSSGNGNNGTISGATWNNDGVKVNLTEDVDYSVSSGTFSLLNSYYDFYGLEANFNCNNLSSSDSALSSACWNLIPVNLTRPNNTYLIKNQGASSHMVNITSDFSGTTFGGTFLGETIMSNNQIYLTINPTVEVYIK